jgi:ectoine hydroxylase-related dioxygenase (phytanoyl-CoA dioxygenase family)
VNKDAIPVNEKSFALNIDHVKQSWHIDCAGARKVPEGQFFAAFDLLLIVPLTDQREEFNGNLLVYPGSHKHPEMMKEIKRFVGSLPSAEFTQEHLLQNVGFNKHKIDLGVPIQTIVSLGDIIILHQKTAHSSGVNLRNSTRLSLNYRIIHKDHETLVIPCLDDPWHGWEGMR